MNTILLNTLTGVVTEADVPFQSVDRRTAGGAAVWTAGGVTDDGVAIVARILTGDSQLGGSAKKRPEAAYFSLSATEGEAQALVKADGAEYQYTVAVRPGRVSRALLGRGIRANYVAFGLTNPDGNAFDLDKIEVSVAASTTRRI